MRNAYNILTYIVDFHLRLIALFNRKISLGVQGRKHSFKIIKEHIKVDDPTLWFHCASLGEYEQGLPVFEKVKALYPDHKVVLSFFSPSGYEHKKDSSIGDLVIYLPLDTKSNARRFVELVHPELVLFVKYEIWPNYLFELQKTKTRTLLISALFRPSQTYFKSSGKWMLNALKTFEWIFVQNDSSVQLLNDYGVSDVSRSGDTRFDRVTNQLNQDNKIATIEDFVDGKLCFVAGSTWPEGEIPLVDFINKDESDTKYIIAPHNIKEARISKLLKSIQRPVTRYTADEDKSLSDYKVLVLDTIGLLSKAYSYADIAYVGGAMGTTGLHNTLEAAIFGVPILIGPNHKRFPEAMDMINSGGMFVVKDPGEMSEILRKLISDKNYRESTGSRNEDYIKKNRGAVVRIMDYLRK
ncbi:MAG: 3-deoxy-D-manno-octulosonic acid transferase [Flavobacteriaceae bacterium]|nr:3-deoxy-D-manno-octulosonic acid transferase [Flavobacteriaceae bacterium]NNK69781.1 3-deoxy-D-manno-octulosonic acid transferase [Flavobacteriaceae bacterium]